MKPTPDQANRSHAKQWLSQYAPPSALIDIYESLSFTTTNSTLTKEDHLNRRMIADIYFTLTGQEIEA